MEQFQLPRSRTHVRVVFVVSLDDSDFGGFVHLSNVTLEAIDSLDLEGPLGALAFDVVYDGAGKDVLGVICSRISFV